MRLPFLHDRIAVIDPEITGTTDTSDVIVEIRILRIAHANVIKQWLSPVNPKISIPPDSQALTGICNAMVRGMRTFSELADEVRLRLEGHLFVAHSARFDCGFTT